MPYQQESCTYLISPGHGDEGRIFILIFWHGRSTPSLSLAASLGGSRKTETFSLRDGSAQAFKALRVIYVNIFRKWAYRGTGITLPDTQLYSAVQVDVTSLVRELECVEREGIGRSQSIALHLHRLVNRIRAATQKQESSHDTDWPAATNTGSLWASLCVSPFDDEVIS